MNNKLGLRPILDWVAQPPSGEFYCKVCRTHRNNVCFELRVFMLI